MKRVQILTVERHGCGSGRRGAKDDTAFFSIQELWQCGGGGSGGGSGGGGGGGGGGGFFVGFFLFQSSDSHIDRCKHSRRVLYGTKSTSIGCMNHVAIKGPSALQVLQQGLTHGFVHGVFWWWQSRAKVFGASVRGADCKLEVVSEDDA